MAHRRPPPIATKERTYVVFKGRLPGVYATWPECHEQVHGFSGAVFRAYNSREDAETALLEYWDPNDVPIEEQVTGQDPGVGPQPLVGENGHPGSSKLQVVLGFLVVLRAVVGLALVLLVLLLFCKIMF